MADEWQVDKLQAAAKKLIQQAQTDRAVAQRLEHEPAKAIAAEAGCPVPAGVLIKVVRGADGKIGLVPEVDPALKGELDDKLLDQVAGGKDSGDDKDKKPKPRSPSSTTLT